MTMSPQRTQPTSWEPWSWNGPSEFSRTEMRFGPSLLVGSPGRMLDLEQGHCLESHHLPALSAAALEGGRMDMPVWSPFYP